MTLKNSFKDTFFTSTLTFPCCADALRENNREKTSINTVQRTEMLILFIFQVSYYVLFLFGCRLSDSQNHSASSRHQEYL